MTMYPAGIDSFTDPTAGDTLDGEVGGQPVLHNAQHSNANAAIEAIETTLGTTGNFKFTQPTTNNTFFVPGLDPTGATDSSAAIQTIINDSFFVGGLNAWLPQTLPGQFYKIDNTITIGNAIQFATTTAAGAVSSGTTLNVASTAAWTAGGYSTGPGRISVWTASETATVIPYTSRSSTTFLGCTGLSGLPASGGNVDANMYVTAGTASSQNNTSLTGGALNSVSPQGFDGFGIPGVTLKWGGATGGTMV